MINAKRPSLSIFWSKAYNFYSSLMTAFPQRGKQRLHQGKIILGWNNYADPVMHFNIETARSKWGN